MRHVNICFLIIIITVTLIYACNESENVQRLTKNDLPQYILELENITVFDSLNSPQLNIEFIKEQTFDSPEGFQFSNYNQIVIGDSGMVYIQNGVYIHAFNANGEHIATMGGEGKGPGEHSGFAKKEMILQANRLFTYDDIQYRINIYSLDTFKPVGAINMDPQKFNRLPNNNEIYSVNNLLHVPLYYPFRDSLLLIRLNPNLSNEIREWSRSNTNRYTTFNIPSYFYLMNRKGEVVSEKIFEAPYKLKIMDQLAGGPPLQPDGSFIMELSSTGNIYTANARDFLIKIYNPEGKYQRAIYYPYKRAPLNQKEFLRKISTKEKVREVIKNSSLPDKWPALTDIMLDDEQRIWVATYTGNATNYKWHILDNEGKHLATFNWPADHYHRSRRVRGGIRNVHNGSMYVYEEKPSDEYTLAKGRFIRYNIQLNEIDDE